MRQLFWLLAIPLVIGCGNTHTPTGPTVSVTCAETGVGHVGNVTNIDTHCDRGDNRNNPVSNPAPVVVTNP